MNGNVKSMSTTTTTTTTTRDRGDRYGPIEDVEAATAEMKRGKAAGLDELTTEHIVYSHPVLLVILAKLFNIIMSAGYVPYGFRLSYTVPLPKVDTISSANVVDNYRVISISPILSKIFERCIF